MSVQYDDLMPGQSDPSLSATDGAQPESPDDDDNLDTLRARLADSEAKADEYLRLAQRTQADFINYRRRMEDERAQHKSDANVAYLQRLLPILDDFERALSNAAPEDLESVWGKGIVLVDRNLQGLLTADDVQRIAAEGAEFDPREHEALGSQPSADVPEGHVVQVIRQGYRKGDRILRPAQVIVASRPADARGQPATGQ
jgi:molecular chaperone GrpE